MLRRKGKTRTGIWLTLNICILILSSLPAQIINSATRTHTYRLVEGCTVIVIYSRFPHHLGLGGFTIPKDQKGNSVIVMQEMGTNLLKHELGHSVHICKEALAGRGSYTTLMIDYITNRNERESEAETFTQKQLHQIIRQE